MSRCLVPPPPRRSTALAAAAAVAVTAFGIGTPARADDSVVPTTAMSVVAVPAHGAQVVGRWTAFPQV